MENHTQNIINTPLIPLEIHVCTYLCLQSINYVQMDTSMNKHILFQNVGPHHHHQKQSAT